MAAVLHEALLSTLVPHNGSPRTPRAVVVQKQFPQILCTCGRGTTILPSPLGCMVSPESGWAHVNPKTCMAAGLRHHDSFKGSPQTKWSMNTAYSSLSPSHGSRGLLPFSLCRRHTTSLPHILMNRPNTTTWVFNQIPYTEEKALCSFISPT